MTQKEMMDEVCYQKCVKFLHDKHQVLIFVHSRNATGQLARTFIDKAANAVCFLNFKRKKNIFF